MHSNLSDNQEAVLIGLQATQVLFLAVHDWIPLGRLNDVSAVRSQDTATRLVVVTMVQTLPFAFGLFRSVMDYGSPFPAWLMQWLWISYLILMVGQLRAWWMPYLIHPDPVRAARYRIMFGKTHSFLPERNGIRPNTAHVGLHLATFLTLLVLLAA